MINTTNGVEHLKRAFKFNFLYQKKFTPMSETLTELITQFLPDQINRYGHTDNSMVLGRLK